MRIGTNNPTNRVIDADVESAAVARLGCFAAQAFPWSERMERWHDGDPVLWYVLSIQHDAGGGWTIVAMRRTCSALLEAIESPMTLQAAQAGKSYRERI